MKSMKLLFPILLSIITYPFKVALVTNYAISNILVHKMMGSTWNESEAIALNDLYKML